MSGRASERAADAFGSTPEQELLRDGLTRFLEQRYDLSAKTDPKVTMTRGKPIPVGPATKLPEGTSWDQLAGLAPDEVREKLSLRARV